MDDIMGMIWAERWRPKELEDFVLSEDLKTKVETWLEEGIFPHLTLYGTYGTGKTSLVKFLLDKFDCDVLEINASKDKGIDLVRQQVSNFLKLSSFGEFKVVVFHEGEALTPQAQEALKEDIEINSDDTRIIFTTNHPEKINGAIASRTLQLQVEPPSPQSVAVRIKHILDAENVEIPDDQKDALWKLVKKNFPDIRSTIKQLQYSIVDGTLKIDRIVDDGDFDELLVLMSEVNSSNKVDKFYEMRKIINSLSQNKIKGIYDFLFYNLDDIYSKQEYYFSVSIIANYQYQSSFDVDIEINVSAMIQELIELKK